MGPWDRIALELTEQTQDVKPTAVYDPSVRATWEAFERATDNIYAIRRQTPVRCRTRTSPKNPYASPKKFKALIQQLKSGIWDGQTPLEPFKSCADRNRFYRTSLSRPSDYMPWTPNEIQLLIKHLKFLENSKRFNPPLRPHICA